MNLDTRTVVRHTLVTVWGGSHRVGGFMGLFDCKQWFPYIRPLVECVRSSARVDSVKSVSPVHTKKARDNPGLCGDVDCLVCSCNSPRTRDTCYRRAWRV